MSNTEYPKMLYTGDKENYSCRAVQDADEERQYRENGLVDYADLDEPKPAAEPDETADISTPQGFITTEQFDAVAERLAAAEAEIERLKTATPEPFFPEMKYADGVLGQDADVVPNSVGGSIGVENTDYNSMTSDQLRALLSEKGIVYLARDNKETLINLLG